jgi:ERCC4-type nuclease
VDILLVWHDRHYAWISRSQEPQKKYKMTTTKFIFDDREHAAKVAFAARIKGRDDIAMESRRLDMGDIIIQDSNAVSPVIIVERKQVADLMNSLFDGRLAEQCSRMQQWKAEHKPGDVWTVIIVEGCASVDTFRASNPDNRFRHFVKTYLQLVLDGKPLEHHLVLRTGAVEETAALLLTLRKTIIAGLTTTNRLLQCSMPRKTQSDAFVRHLCCTQGISVQRALRIKERFCSVTHLGEAVATDLDGTLDFLKDAIGSGKVAARLLEDLGHSLPSAVVSKKRKTQSGLSSSSPSKSSNTGL